MAGEGAVGKWFLLIAFLVLLAAGAWVALPFLSGLVFALVLAYLLHPLHVRITRRVRSKRLAAALVLLLVTFAVVAPLAFITYHLWLEALVILAAIQEGGGFEDVLLAAAARAGMEEPVAREVLANALATLIEAGKGALVPALGIVSRIGLNLFAFLFVLYYALAQWPALDAYIRRAIPLPDATRNALLAKVGARLRALFQGTFLVGLIQGVVAGLGWWFFGFPAPIFWGAVMTILSILPAAGPFLVLVPAGLYALLAGDVYAGVGIIVYALAVVGLVDNFARPHIVSRSSGVHPVLVLVGTLGGVLAFGVTGFLLGPLILSMISPVLEALEEARATGTRL